MSEAKARELLYDAIHTLENLDREGWRKSSWDAAQRWQRNARAYLAAVPVPPAEPRVPREPTREMMDAASIAQNEYWGLPIDEQEGFGPREIWRAMYDAAPAAEPVAQQPPPPCTPLYPEMLGISPTEGVTITVEDAAPQPEAPQAENLVRDLEIEAECTESYGIATVRKLCAKAAPRIRELEAKNARLTIDSGYYADNAERELAASRERERALKTERDAAFGSIKCYAELLRRWLDHPIDAYDTELEAQTSAALATPDSAAPTQPTAGAKEQG